MFYVNISRVCFMLGGFKIVWVSFEFLSFLQAVFFFIELVVFKRICKTLVYNCTSNDQKWNSKDNLLSWNYTIVLSKTTLTFSWRRPLSYRNQTGFYMTTASVMKELKKCWVFFSFAMYQFFFQFRVQHYY